VVRKRSDGFHDLETIFYPLPLHDVLELIPNVPENTENFSEIPFNGSAIYFTSSGLKIPGNPEDNIVIRACRLLLQNRNNTSFQILLHKKIPMGAGLGGGSANGAFMLQVLNEVFQMNCSKGRLASVAKELGSDCPFFLENKPMFATGRGEFMENIAVDLSGYSLLLIYSGIHIPTAKAFSEIQPAAPEESLKNVIRLPLTEWKNHLINDFEKNIFQHHPKLATIKKILYEQGAIYASMTGSGSCMYGLFPAATPPAIRLPEDCVSWFIPSI
jgi:4-diphosphocytidyl-2-C-methyl-D-erythritol kinase